MNAREGEVIEGELVEADPAILKQALALPGARNVALPEYFDSLLAALDKCDKLDHLRQAKDHAEEAAICARRLRDGHLIEKARKITAYTLRKMGEHLNKIPEGQRGPKRSNVTPITIRSDKKGGAARSSAPTTRAEAAQRAGITASAARRASNIASIDSDTFTTLVEQPGSCSTRVLEEVARDQRGRGTASAGHRTAGLRRHAEAKMKEFSTFIGMYDAKTVAKLFGSDRSSMKKIATTSRDWLTTLIRALE